MEKYNFVFAFFLILLVDLSIFGIFFIKKIFISHSIAQSLHEKLTVGYLYNEIIISPLKWLLFVCLCKEIFVRIALLVNLEIKFLCIECRRIILICSWICWYIWNRKICFQLNFNIHINMFVFYVWYYIYVVVGFFSKFYLEFEWSVRW